MMFKNRANYGREIFRIILIVWGLFIMDRAGFESCDTIVTMRNISRDRLWNRMDSPEYYRLNTLTSIA